MKRRTLFKAGSLLGGAVLFNPFPAAGTVIVPNTPVRSGFRRFPLGDLELSIVSDGNLIMGPVQPFFAPDAPAEAVRSLLADNFRPTDHIELSINILVVKKAGKLILIDTGMGVNAGEPGEKGITNGVLIPNLQTAGFAPGDFTDIVITHAHPDHIGGLLTKAGQPAFPNAKIYLGKTEYEFWTSASPDFSKSRVDPKMIGPMSGSIKKMLLQLRPQITFYHSGDKLLECISPELAAGHTPGHSLIHIYSGSEEIVHVADLVHSDVLLFPHPEWGFFGDADFKMGAETRRAVLNKLAGARTRVMAYHLPWPGLGHVRKKGDGFEWVPEMFAGAEMG